MEILTKVCRDCGRELPVEKFKKNRYGERVSVCTESATRKMRENKEKKRIEETIKVKEKARADAEVRNALSGFTPRQLMEELSRRGYKGKLTYTRIEEIDITNF